MRTNRRLVAAAIAVGFLMCVAKLFAGMNIYVELQVNGATLDGEVSVDSMGDTDA